MSANEKYIKQLINLRTILETPEGFEFMVLHLKSLGAGQIFEHTQTRNLIEKNVAEGLLQTIFEASPALYAKIQLKLKEGSTHA